jgi:LmbE family N-acetylglucosaminyl deacetylase
MTTMGRSSRDDYDDRGEMMESPTKRLLDELPDARSVLVVCAHPDDESFGLGAVLAKLGELGSSTSVLCFTHGEASTLGADSGDLGRVRAGELAAAASELGVGNVELLDYRDGRLAEEKMDELTAPIRRATERAMVDLLLVFDEGGITGHPDHCRATEAGIAAARELDLPVLAWALPQRVTEVLNSEFSAGFVGRRDEELDYFVSVERTRQLRAIDQHVSQATDNPVLGRRLELQGNREAFRWLSRPRGTTTCQ